MITYVYDLTEDFNADSIATLDISAYEQTVVQLVSPSGAVNFLATNDGGAVQSVTDGSPLTATNFIGVQGTNLNTGVAATSGSASGLWKFGIVGKYLRLSGTAVTATKVLVFQTKPY